MANATKIAELLIEIGVDAKDAQKAADKVATSLKKVGESGEVADKGVDKATKSLKRFEAVGNAAGKIADTMGKALVGVAGVVTGLATQVLKVGGTFESLRVQLKTTTGSAAGAEKAFQFIREFAKNTPFQVEQITEAFVKLSNFGIKPTERNLTAFGDFASAMGKDLNQFIEAVLDATTGEFERLKEFGIKTKSEGDRVKFTFQGVTTEVGKNAGEIQEFLTRLSEQNFGGAMSEQMSTLGGVISNLKDTWSDFLNTVAGMGVIDEFKGLIEDLKDATGKDKGGLAKQLADVLVSAIRQVRNLIAGDFLPTLSKLLDALKFLVEHADTLAIIFAGGKLTSGLNATIAGLRSMGLAASASLGPIGAIISALGVLIPLAIDAGNALGNALAKQQDLVRVARGAPRLRDPTLETAESRLLVGTQTQANKELLEAERNLASLKESGASDADIQLASLTAKQKAKSLQKAQKAVTDFEDAQRAARDAREERDATNAENLANLTKAHNAAFAAADKETLLQEVVGKKRILGMRDKELERLLAGDTSVLTPSELKKFEAGEAALDSGEGLDVARSVAKKAGRGSGRGPKKKKEKKKKPAVTSPTTVSEFFAAAARGELGPIADRTPAAKDIEPTVAVTITNNNFAFKDTFNITGVNDPMKTGEAVIKQIKAEFDRRLSNAGQALQPNMAR